MRIARLGSLLACIVLPIVLLSGRVAVAAPAEITMWDVPESEAYTGWWRKHVAQFNADHPDVKVTLEVFETEAYRSKIASALAAGTMPDIFYLPAGPQGFQAYRDGQARSIEGLLDAGKFTEGSMTSCSVEGKLVCLPLYIAPNLFYYNKSMFSTAGVDTSKWANPMQPTWDEFLGACKALKAAGLVPLALGIADNWPGTMYMWSFQNRLGGLDELAAATAGRDGATFATSKGFKLAAEKVAEIGASGFLPLGYNGIGGGQKYALFTSGQAAIIYQGPWLLGRISAETPTDFSFGFFAFPKMQGGPAAAQEDVLGGFDALFVSAKTQHPEAVASFLNGFAADDAAVAFMRETRNISVVRSALKAGPGEGILGDIAAATARAPHITPWWDNYLPNAVQEEATRQIQGLFDGSVTPAAYLEAMDKAAKR